MFETNELLEVISKGEKTEICQNNNDDKDLGGVLRECNNFNLNKHELKCSDGRMVNISLL